ncbi:MAG: N-acetylneuraminate synthase family protein [Candidatus Undinarchaeales archaeon]
MKLGPVDLNKKTFVIAEVGGNHGGNFEVAKEYVDAAAETGADAVKFQMYTAEKLITKNVPPLPLAGDNYESQQERFRELQLTSDEYSKLAEYSKRKGIMFSATPFDNDNADVLEDLTEFYKIASGDLTDLPLLRHVKEKGKLIVLSTGFSTADEIKKTLSYLPQDRTALLHCVGTYPCPLEGANLLSISYMQEKFNLPVGYSDHTIGIDACRVAVSLGAKIIEKHFTLDKTIKTGDHRLSADKSDMSELVKSVKKIRKNKTPVEAIISDKEKRKKLLGKKEKKVQDSEFEIKKSMRRSLAAKVPIKKGEKFTNENLIPLRPETGISPMLIDKVVGKKCKLDMYAEQILTKAHVSL